MPQLLWDSPCAWPDTLLAVQNPDHLEPFLWKLQTVYFFTPTNDKYQWKKTVVISTHFCLELCLVLTLSSNFAWALIDMKRDAVMCLKTQVKQPQKVFQISLTIFLRRFMNEFISTYTTFSRSCVSIRMLNTSYSFTSDARSTIGTHQRELKALKRALLLKDWLHGKISSRQTGLEKIPIKWNISWRTETGIGSELRQEFLGSLCCFGNIHLPTPFNDFFSPDWKFFARLHWTFQRSQPGWSFNPGWNFLHVIASSVFGLPRE